MTSSSRDRSAGSAVELALLAPDKFLLRCPYTPTIVAALKALPNRAWKPQEQRWELHIANLPAVMKLFALDRTQVERPLLRAFQMFRIRQACIRISVGNVTSKIVGSGLPLKKIEDATSFLVPGHQYMPLFVKKRWDGRRRLFNKRNQTLPTGLLPRVTAILDAEGLFYEIAQEPQPPHDEIEVRRPALNLRDYQSACLESAVAGKRGVIELATGSGKTAVAACIIAELRRSTLFIVHTRDLLHQTRTYFEEQLGGEIGQVGDGVVNVKPITVATVQTCAKVLGLKLPKEDDDEEFERDRTDLKSRMAEIQTMIRSAQVVFFDECHHLPAETFYGLAMETHGAAYRYGLSATPYRSDRLDILLEAALGPKLYQANASVLIEQGFLVPPRIEFHPVPQLPASKADADYQAVFIRHVITNPARNQMIAEQAQRLASRGKSVLVLVNQVRHGEILRKLVPEAPLVQGSDASETRRHIFAQLACKDLKIVIATTLADEGLDIPSLDSVVLASGGRSETRALQRLGRALRVSPGKKIATIVDFMDSAPFLREHSERRKAIFESEPMFEVTIVGAKQRPAAAKR